MGTWNTKINGNDAFQDIYQNFFDLYNQGQNPADISKQIQNDFTEMFNDYDDRNNSLFGLAFAQWETKSLDSKIYKQVKEIIETGEDLELWKGLGADSKTLKQRQTALDKFLLQISTEKEKPKRRAKQKFEYRAVELFKLVAPDSNKTFEIVESYVNGNYTDTCAMLNWNSGGGSGIFSFNEKGKYISAKWIDSQTVEVLHDRTIKFYQKVEKFYYCGDQGVIKYIEK